jgi:hypothetical protein
MANIARDLIKCRISNDPGTTGSFILDTAFTNSLLPAAADDGLKFKLNITENGVGTEIRRNCTYTHSTTTFSRGTMVRSTAAADAALDFTSAAIVSVVPSAEDYLTGIVIGLSTANTSDAATANHAAIQAELDAGGLVQILAPGTYYINKTLLVPSYTELRMAPGARLKKYGGLNQFHLIRNKYAQNGCYVNGATVSGGEITINDYGHPWEVGDQVYVEGMLTNTTLNGAKTVTATVPGVSWTYAASGANPTNSAVQLAFTSPYYPIAGSNFTRASNVVTVLESGHVRGRGDRLWIAGLSGTNSFNGVVEIVGVDPGVSWTYANTGANETATGTAQVLGDQCITVNLDMDGNVANMTYNQWGVHLSHWGNISKFDGTIFDSRYGTGGRVVNVYNATDFHIPLARASESVAVVVQFDSYCDRCVVGTILAPQAADDLLAWGVTSAEGVFADTSPPTGPGSMGALIAGNLIGSSPTGLLKMYCKSGYSLGDVHIGTIRGRGPITIGDGADAGVSGGSFNSLSIESIEVEQYATDETAMKLGNGGLSSTGSVYIGRFVDRGVGTDLGMLLNIGSAFASITIGELVSTIGRVRYGILVGANVGRLTVNSGTVSSAGDLSNWILTNPGIVDILQLSNIKYSANGTSNGNLISESGDGYVKSIYITNFDGYNCRSVFTGQSAGLTHNIYASNMRLTTVGSPFGYDATGTFNLSLSNVECVSTPNNLLQFYVAGQVIRAVANGLKAPTGQYCLFYDTIQVGLDGKDWKIDLGANAGSPPSQLVPVAGDQVWNTNATGTGLYGRTAAGAWTQIF